MTYALREVLRLTKIETEEYAHFAPLMLQVFMNLVEDMADLCQAHKVDLTQMSPFELKTNDWHIALLQIYEQIYQRECRKFKDGPIWKPGD